MSTSCIFCEIVARRAPASVVYEDDRVIAFMTIQQTQPGECLVIPKAHVDHFHDLDDGIASHILVTAQQISRKMKISFDALRVGYVVSGFGVAHAHLIIVPLHHPHDITSRHYLTFEAGDASFSDAHIAPIPRPVLDMQARTLATAFPGIPAP